MVDAMDGVLRERVEAVVGKSIVDCKRPQAGQTLAERFVVKLQGGGGVFAKAAVDEQTEQWLRAEHLVLTSVREDFVPVVVEWLEPEEGFPILLTEDLSDAHWPADHWPVNWRTGQMDALIRVLERLAEVSAPSGLPAMGETGGNAIWRGIEVDAEEFLRLGLCSETWLMQALPALIEAEMAVDLRGDVLVHDDVRSDNLCFLGDRLVLVDWSQAMRGHGEYDRTKTLPTLTLEGGPEPYEIMPNAGSWAARGCAVSAQRAWVERDSRPEWLINVFKRLAAIELVWAAKCLELPEVDGTNWRQI